MTSNTERRTEARKRPVSLVYVELPPANGGMMRDLSERGFSLRAMMPLRPSEKVAFSFLLDSSARIDGEAIVVRLQDSGHVAALEFAGLSAHAREQIRSWLNQRENPFPKESEAGARPAASENSTFEELRSEIRSMESRPVEIPPEPESARREVPAGPTVPTALAAEPPSPPSQVFIPPTLEAPLSEPADRLAGAHALPVKPGPAIQPAEMPSLLRLSSVRPGPEKPPAMEVTQFARNEEDEDEAVDIPVKVVPDTPLSYATPQASQESPAAFAQIVVPEPLRMIPPALEPLSALEGETDATAPGWMERFTLGRAIGVMLVLTLLAGSFVFHREVGHALIWIGQQIAGEESPESLRQTPPTAPAASVPPAGNPASPAVQNPSIVEKPDSSPALPAAETTEAKSADLSAATQTPSLQTKESKAPSLLPLTQVTRVPVAPTTAPVTMEEGQSEYQQAQTILRAPGREAEYPAAARLLWTAVEKGNVSAEIALAELYRTGRGVARNCTQAKILLATAAHKGNAEAQKRLADLQREGCQQ